MASTETQLETAIATEMVQNIAQSMHGSLVTIKTDACSLRQDATASDDADAITAGLHVATETVKGISETSGLAESYIIPPGFHDYEVHMEEMTLQNEEQVAVTMAHSLHLPTSAHSPDEELLRQHTFWQQIVEVMNSKNSDMILGERIERIRRVLENTKVGKNSDEPPRFMYYIRSRQFALKSAPELGWTEEVVCEPTKEEDLADNSLLGNWRQVAVAEDIYHIIKEVHESTTPHKNYKKTYFEVQRRYARIPRHVCLKFIDSCPRCNTLKKERSSISVGGTPKRPIKRRSNPLLPVRIIKMSKVAMEDFKLKGLIAAPFTPFEDNGDLNTRLIAKYVNVLREDGVNSVFVLGTTAEGPSLTLKERKVVAGEWVKSAKGKLDHVIVQVGTNNLKETQELAIHAFTIGASAIAVLPPTYFKPKSPENLVNYLKEVGAAVPTMPLFYYHIPVRTGVDFTMMEILRALEADPFPNFKGAKFVTTDLTDFSLSVNVCKDKYQMIYSHDGMILPSMTLGGEAYVGSTFNFAGKLFTRLTKAYADGDIERARAEQFRMHAFLDVLNRFAKESADCSILKYIMALARFDVGPPRPPLTQMCPEDIEQLRKELTDIGFFDWIN